MLGPLFYKELLEVSRRRRYYVARTLVGLAMLIGLWLGIRSVPDKLAVPKRPRPPVIARPMQGNFPPQVRAPQTQTGRPVQGAWVPGTTAQLAACGKRILDGWTTAVWAGIFLIVPAITSGLIAGEKDSRTLEILFTTCLSDGEILWGKLASRLLWFFVLLASSIPVLIIASWYGGIGLGAIANAAMMQTAAIFFTAFLGLYYSTVTQKPYVALIRTYFTLLVFEGALYFLDAVLPLYIAINLLLSVLLFQWCQRRLRTAWTQTGDPLIVRIARRTFQSLVSGARRFVEARQRMTAMRQLWQLEQQSRTGGRMEYWLGDRSNPLLQRNASANVYDPQRYIAAIQLMLWIGVISAISFVGHQDPNSLTKPSIRPLLSLAALVLLLLLAILAASSFAREKQHGSWELLTLTDLTPEQFVNGTISGVLRTLWPALTLFALVSVLLGYTVLLSSKIALWLLVVVSIAALLMMICLANSLASRNINEAMARSLTAIALLQLFGYQGLPEFWEPLDAYSEPIFLVAAGWLLLLALRHHRRVRAVNRADLSQAPEKPSRLAPTWLTNIVSLQSVLIPLSVAMSAQVSANWMGYSFFMVTIQSQQTPTFLNLMAWLGPLTSTSTQGHVFFAISAWTSVFVLWSLMLKHFNRLAIPDGP